MNVFPVIAIGTCTTNLEGKILDVRYDLMQSKDDPIVNIKSSTASWGSDYNSLLSYYEKSKENNYEITDYSKHPRGKREREKIIIHKLEKDESIKDVKDAYLKLHLLSKKLVKPNSINLDGIFAALPNVAWTNHGPMDPMDVDRLRNNYDFLYIKSLDKFPCLTDYIIPDGVRIADAARVRLGAYLSEGTTVMHEGFVNFNAGTLGPTMIEGRISAGVTIGANSDLGGGCSTMGTLSGGNEIKISVGEDCLLGANSGLGIPLGDRCTIEAGLYLTGGSKVQVMDQENNVVSTVKASELASKSDLLFIRNSLSGAIQCKPNKKSVVLNDQLHTND
jgi:2,3,4,5-tetrahydropyridine-2-carboxylate N-succinyltransferase